MKKPNILLVYTDQMRYDATSFGGNPNCKTPAIDKMAEEGVCFDNAHTAFPLCCPFRGSLMTGKHAHKHGVMTNHVPIPLDQEFLPEMVKKQGYRTAWIGKWHLNGAGRFQPVEKVYQCGFDVFKGYGRGHHYINSVYYNGEVVQPYKSDKYEPEYQTDQIIDFMSQSVKDDVPFMGMVCYGLPHHPVDMAPDKYKYMYNKDDIVLQNDTPEYMQDEAKQYKAYYYGLVICVDDQIARLNAYLEENNLKENTMFIFVSDHGDMCCEGGYNEKSISLGSSSHVPYIIQYPALAKEARRIDAVVDPTISIVPTILDVCGAKIPDYMPGKSLKKIVAEGSDDKLDDYCYYQLIKKYDREVTEDLNPADYQLFGERGFRTKDLLYVEKSNVPFLLFDLRNDPHEKYNRVDDYKYLRTVLECRKKLKSIMADLDDNWSVEVTESPYLPNNKANMFENYNALYNRAIYEK